MTNISVGTLCKRIHSLFGAAFQQNIQLFSVFDFALFLPHSHFLFAVRVCRNYFIASLIFTAPLQNNRPIWFEKRLFSTQHQSPCGIEKWFKYIHPRNILEQAISFFKWNKTKRALNFKLAKVSCCFAPAYQGPRSSVPPASDATVLPSSQSSRICQCLTQSK